MVASEADEAWCPPTFSPSSLSRRWLALWIVQLASHRTFFSSSARTGRRASGMTVSTRMFRDAGQTGVGSLYAWVGDLQNIVGRKTPMRIPGLIFALSLFALAIPAFAADSPSGDVAREFVECIGCSQMVAVPAGKFLMGSPAS